MSGSLVKRKIDVRFTLDAPAGTFTESGTNTVDLSGLRCHVSLVANNSTAMNQLDLVVYGMPLSVMNKLTILQNGYTQGVFNQIEVTAGDGDTMALIFSGAIFTAWADFSGAPEVAFIVQAFTELSSSYKSVPPTSFKGTVDAAQVATGIAAQMTPPLTLENSGVDVQLTDPYLAGDAMAQLRSLAKQASFEWSTDKPGTLAIWPAGKPRNASEAKISAGTNMVGYPSYNDKGVMVTALFDPSIAINAPVTIESVSTPANGTWYPFNVQHDLEAEVPEGRWFTHIEAQRFTGQGAQVAVP